MTCISPPVKVLSGLSFLVENMYDAPDCMLSFDKRSALTTVRNLQNNHRYTYIPMLGLVFTAEVELFVNVIPNNLPNCSIPDTKFWLVAGDVYTIYVNIS